MCAFCSTANIPACLVTNSCSNILAQNAKIIILGAMPIAGGVGIWAQTKLQKKKKGIKNDKQT